MTRHCRFRWAVCQVDRLRRSFPASIRRVLNELPRTLDETYERILLEIDEEKQEYAIRLFQCLAFSLRPLRVKELAEVIAVELDVRGVPRLNVNFRPGDADEAVLSACSTLVTIVKPDDTTFFNNDVRVVQFSHYSVKEFLTSERLAKSERGDLAQYYISPEPAHTILAQSCISTLLQPDIYIGYITDSSPLAKYAAQNWFRHAQCDGVASQIQGGMERLFDPDRNHFALWISIHDIDKRSYWDPPTRTQASPLYYATLCGIRSIVEHLVITSRQDPKESYGRRGNPLHVAVIMGHAGVARLLLEHTVDVNARDRNAETPLHAAVRSGNLDIAQLLLSHGADLNTLDNKGESPLHRAVQTQNLDAVEFLLNNGADVNAQGMNTRCPLHAAEGRGNLDIVQLLLSRGADAKTLDNRGNSLLRKAIQLQKFDLAELLLKSGADVNAPDDQGYSLLQKAVQYQNRDTVGFLLLKGGANVNVRNYHKATPLHKATESGNFDIVRLLLSHGGDVNSLDNKRDYCTRQYDHKTPTLWNFYSRAART
jgi:ankyrin repeat protein